MNNLIDINYTTETPTVSGRELHKALEVKTAYKDWFPRMCEYGFCEGKDFCSKMSESTGGRPSIDHQLTIPMAKELCMIQRSEKGKMFRQYFIKVEENWNSPDMVMKRAFDILTAKVNKLQTQTEEQSKMIEEMKPKVSYYDIVLQCKDLVLTTVIAKDYGMSAMKLNQILKDKGIQYKRRGTWLLYSKYEDKGYTGTRTHITKSTSGEEYSFICTCWTQKGRLFIYDLLKKDGILPVIERDCKVEE